MAARIGWEGVFPAITTQFGEDFSLDIEATRRLIEAQIRDGAAGLIVCGTVGESASLEKSEKIAVMEAAKDVVEGRVPVLVGVAEYTTAFAADFAREAARVGVDGLMVLPAMVYSAKPAETLAHFPTGNAVYPAASPHAVCSTPVEMTKVYRGVRLSGSGAPPGEP